MSSSGDAAAAKLKADAVLDFLRKHDKDLEKQFIEQFGIKNEATSESSSVKTEIKQEPGTSSGSAAAATPASSSASSAAGQPSTMLNSYKSDNDPTIYEDAYLDLVRFVDGSLDLYRHELSLILYPVFVHMYLELVYNRHEQAAQKFVERFGKMQESFFQEDIKKLSYITKKQVKTFT